MNICQRGPERYSGSGFTFDDFFRDLRAVLFINALYADAFFLIGAHLVVYDDIKKYGNLMLFSALIAANS